MEETGIGEVSEISLSPSLPSIPLDVKPKQVGPPKRSVINRRGIGTEGRHISLLTNHFKVSINTSDAIFYQYSVCLLFVS